MNAIARAICLVATAFWISAAHSQIKLNNTPKTVPPCPIVQPEFSNDMGVPEYYERYMGPVRKYKQYLGKIIKGQAPTPMHVNAIYQILREQYATLDHLTKKSADLFGFVNDVNVLYENKGGYPGLDTLVATSIARAGKHAYLVDLFGNDALCVVPSRNNINEFEMHFYGVRQKDCERMTRFQGGIANEIYVNGNSSIECAPDIKAEPIRRYLFWSNLGRNQVTLVFGK